MPVAQQRSFQAVFQDCMDTLNEEAERLGELPTDLGSIAKVRLPHGGPAGGGLCGVLCTQLARPGPGCCPRRPWSCMAGPGLEAHLPGISASAPQLCHPPAPPVQDFLAYLSPASQKDVKAVLEQAKQHIARCMEGGDDEPAPELMDTSDEVRFATERGVGSRLAWPLKCVGMWCMATSRKAPSWLLAHIPLHVLTPTLDRTAALVMLP